MQPIASAKGQKNPVFLFPDDEDDGDEQYQSPDPKKGLTAAAAMKKHPQSTKNATKNTP